MAYGDIAEVVLNVAPVAGILDTMRQRGISHEAIKAVLRKLGIDPSERMNDLDQDAEFTACRADEIPRYFRLYTQGNLGPVELDVLCCFLLESLNDCLHDGTPHPLQEDIFAALFNAGELHADELAYWMNTPDPDEENWAPITKVLLQHRDGGTRPC